MSKFLWRKKNCCPEGFLKQDDRPHFHSDKPGYDNREIFLLVNRTPAPPGINHFTSSCNSRNGCHEGSKEEDFFRKLAFILESCGKKLRHIARKDPSQADTCRRVC